MARPKGYAEAFGPVEGVDYEVVEVPDGEAPPDEVMERNRLLGEAAKANAADREHDVDTAAKGMGSS